MMLNLVKVILFFPENEQMDKKGFTSRSECHVTLLSMEGDLQLRTNMLDR